MSQGTSAIRHSRINVESRRCEPSEERVDVRPFAGTISLFHAAGPSMGSQHCELMNSDHRETNCDDSKSADESEHFENGGTPEEADPSASSGNATCRSIEGETEKKDKMTLPESFAQVEFAVCRPHALRFEEEYRKKSDLGNEDEEKNDGENVDDEKTDRVYEVQDREKSKRVYEDEEKSDRRNEGEKSDMGNEDEDGEKAGENEEEEGISWARYQECDEGRAFQDAMKVRRSEERKAKRGLATVSALTTFESSPASSSSDGSWVALRPEGLKFDSDSEETSTSGLYVMFYEDGETHFVRGPVEDEGNVYVDHKGRRFVLQDGVLSCKGADGTDSVVGEENDESTPAARQRQHARRLAARGVLPS